MSRKYCSTIIFICMTLLGSPFPQVNIWAGAPKTAQIVFRAHGRDGNQSDIYVMGINGGRQRNLTKHAIANEVHPAWSPDGRKIVFVSDRDGNSNIYVMDTDGKNVQRLTDHPLKDNKPAWSPDGKKIAFNARQHDQKNFDIYVMDADGKNVQRLTNHPASDTDPAWSPNGRKIAFDSGREGNTDIYVMDADGGNMRRLTHHLAFEIMPAWSPNGRKIAFVSYGQGRDSEIYIMDADGENIVQLTTCPAQYPVWSPDGKQLVFESNKNPDGVPNSDPEIYVIDANGENERQLTRNRTGDLEPDWFDPAVPRAVSPIGQRVILWGQLKQLNRQE